MKRSIIKNRIRLRCKHQICEKICNEHKVYTIILIHKNKFYLIKNQIDIGLAKKFGNWSFFAENNVFFIK